MSRPFMPFYNGDWMRDTAHLDDSQERAYFRLVMFYWDNGGLPKEDAQLRRICRKHHYWWSKNRKLLIDFFEVNELGYWIHKRIDYELGKIEKFSQKQSANAAKRYSKPMPEWLPNGCQNDARARVSHPQPKESYSLNGKESFYAKLDSPQWKAWTERYRQDTGKAPPVDKNGGWLFPAEWPPE